MQRNALQIPMIWKVILMKRIFALLLCAAMLLSLAACGSSGSQTSADSTTAATKPATEATEPVAEVTDAPTEPPVTQAAMMETTLVDDENVTVSITGVESNEHLGMQLYIQCVNKTDRTLMFSWDMVSVCGFMYDPMWAEEVAAGKTANSTVYLDTFALEQMGVTSVDEISFTLRVFDSENWMEAPLVEDAFTIYPTGLSAETLQLPIREETPGQVVIGDDYVRFIIEGVDAEDPSAYTVYVYLENNTDRNLMYAWDMVSVNGCMIDPFWAASVAAGKKACSEITFYRSDLENNGIEDVSGIEFTLTVSDYDDWSADYLLEETYTYQP